MLDRPVGSCLQGAARLHVVRVELLLLLFFLAGTEETRLFPSLFILQLSLQDNTAELFLLFSFQRRKIFCVEVLIAMVCCCFFFSCRFLFFFFNSLPACAIHCASEALIRFFLVSLRKLVCFYFFCIIRYRRFCSIVLPKLQNALQGLKKEKEKKKP